MGLMSNSSRRQSRQRGSCDPMPNRFTIKKVYRSPKVWHGGILITLHNYLLAEIIYPNYTTFEGRKLILFEGVAKSWLFKQRAIDPHFNQGSHIIARFEPSKRGLALAKKVMGL